MTARDISSVLKEQDARNDSCIDKKSKNSRVSCEAEKGLTETQELQSDFVKYRTIREAHRIYFGELSDEMVEKAGEAVKKLFLETGHRQALHVYLYYHEQTKRQLNNDPQYRHIIRAMHFGGV